MITPTWWTCTGCGARWASGPLLREMWCSWCFKECLRDKDHQLRMEFPC